MGQPVSTGSRAAVFTGRDGDGGREARARWHGTLHRDGAGEGEWDERAQSHLKGRRAVQLKLLIRELRKATRSETKGAR